VRNGRRARLTKRVVDDAHPEASRYAIWDTDLLGFGLRVEPGGLKSYFVRYRGEGGGRRAPQRFLKLGRHGELTADSARRIAKDTLADVRRGEDPAAMKAARRMEPTVGNVLDRYLAEHASHHNKRTTLLEAHRHVNTSIKPRFGRTRIGDLTRAEIKGWHTSFADRPYEGNRALAVLRKALNLAVTEWELRPDNPCLGVKPFPEIKRDRFFSDEELRRIGEALATLEEEGAIPLGHSRCIRLLAMTGMRLTEVMGLRWDWLDAQHHCFRLPDTKGGARTVMLGTPVLSYLASLERTCPFVCPGKTGDRPLAKRQFYGPWLKVAAAARLENARPHDFRHTVGTYGAQTGANAFLIRDQLGHKTVSPSSRQLRQTSNCSCMQ
jgi:integrase